MSAPRVLVAGDFAWEVYEPSLCAALREAGACAVFASPGALREFLSLS